MTVTPASIVDRLFALHVAGLPLPSISGGAPDGDGQGNDDKGKSPDLVKAVEGLIARHGDSMAALRVLLAENHGYRDEIRKLKETQPPADALVLKGDDAKAWQAYVTLGKPSDLRKALDDGKTAQTEADGFRREKLHGEAAALHGFKAAVLDRLARQDGLTIEIKDEKDKAGKAVKVAHVKGEGDASTPLTEYAEKQWSEFLPSLKAGDKGAVPGTPPRRNGVPTPTPVVTGETRTVRPMF